MKTNLRVSIFALILICFTLFACGRSTGGFVPAPPPVEATNVMNIQQVAFGNAQIMNITSPTIRVEYTENGVGAGSTATEVVTIDNVNGTMLSVDWGSWPKAALELVNYYDNHGNLVSAMIVAKFDQLSLFQLFTGNAKYTLDRSSVTLVYERAEDDDGLVLNQIQYTEKWGPGRRELAFGGYAVWTDRFEELLPRSYMEYGFWEANGTPAEQVKTMLERAMGAADRGILPNFKAVDTDSGREVIGRQTGLRLYESGQAIGHCDFSYENTVGRQPNTGLIGKGALSRVDCAIKDGTYHIVVLSPRATPVGNALYVFTNSAATADALSTKENANNPSRLYSPLRGGEYEGVFLSIHGMGDIGVVPGDEGAHIGDEGGVQWRMLGDASYDDIVLASNLLALLGPAQYQTGFYYAYAPGSGSGMSYYLAALRLMHAPADTVFSVFGQDVGVLDRVLVPDIHQFLNN